jgi:PAS domain S-box-containing protein
MSKILIVDDEQSIRDSLSFFLQEGGYQTATAEDVAHAEALLQRQSFDVVVTDILLPGISGVALLEHLRAQVPDALVLMMTGNPSLDTAVAAVRAGAYDYLSKPITKEMILPAVARAVQVRELQAEKARLEAANQEYQENLEHLVKERTEALQKAEARYRGLVETAFDWVWEVDAECRYTYASPRVWDLLGYRPEEVIGRTPFEFMPEGEVQRVRALYEGFAAARQPFVMLENTNRHRDGRLIVLESSGVPIPSPDGTLLGYRGMDRDITQRKAAEEQVRKLARAVEQSPVSIVITDREGHIEFVNPRFSQVTGYSHAEALGQNARVLESGEPGAEGYRELWASTSGGNEWRGEFHNKRKDGKQYWESASISPIRDSAGEITHFIAVKEDITEQKLTAAKLLRAQRVETIGSLASGIAHDLNNILTPIVICTPMLLEDDTPEGRQAMVQTIANSAQRAVDIVKQLLSFARGKEGRKGPVQLRHYIRDLSKMARETFPRSIKIAEQCPSDLWPVLADTTQMHQVLLNLCVNARDAMPAGGTLSLQAENVTLTPTDLAGQPAAKPGAYVRLQVTDTGTGIPEAVQPHIFELFFTTKGEEQGTGLGLTTVQGIVKEHQGFISFKTSPGQGTTFEVLLPAATEGAPAVTTTPDGKVIPRGHGELILIVDDEPNICQATRITLERYGYRVLVAQDGVEALALFGAHQHEVRAVVTDFMMPLMDGVALCRTLRQISPGTHLIVSSGGLFGQKGDAALKEFAAIGIPHILHKPHNTSVLLQTLSEALATDPAAPPAL